MRIRSVKPDFWNDDVTGLMSAEVALFFIGLWNWADDEGRFRWDPVLIRAAIDPFDAKFGGPATISRRLEDLARLRRIVRYEVDGRVLGYIPSATEHFNVNRPTKSKLPKPPKQITESSVRNHGGLTPGEDRRGEEGRVQEPARKASPPAPSPAPEFRPTQTALVAVFSEERGDKYLWQGAKDTEGLKRILGLGVPLSEILDRWRAALRRTKYPTVGTVAQLAAKWNEVEVDPYEAGLNRIRERAEAELDRAGPGDGSGPGAPEQRPAREDPVPAFGAALRSAVPSVLGDRGSAGVVQDGADLEHRAEHGRAEAPRPVR
jgi:hypothetical protein